ncbi:LuxR family transcriptional regulator [Sphingomonas lacunae]|uniref:LuxR family transcriptional regulator n=1 Tax=Sphingomonas lacunae TaxID=2698828 RepID=A0A6M4AU93_9SPHN|nr:LuxR family transcriptional regulator [Sphingomonas lacunae]QJQ32594.1 LuxR family transcriptional regulator [Sphingomonas lacunae]
MAFQPTDQRELILPLLAGIYETPPWHSFMTNLVARTHARRAFLLTRAADAPTDQGLVIRSFAAPRANADAPLDYRRISGLDLLPLDQLRPGRVYSLEEMLDFSDAALLAHQRSVLVASGVRYGRWVHISAGVADAWIILTREREDFSAAAVALLSSMTSHFAAALLAQAKLSEQRLQAAMAHQALARLGIGQLAFDRTGRVLLADPQAEAMLTIIDDGSGRLGRRLHLLPEASRQFAEACAEVADADSGSAAVVPLDPLGEAWLLLHKANLPDVQTIALPAVIGIVRRPVEINDRFAKPVISSLYGLSEREAALACGMANGGTITDTGADLRLTKETSRNYSKRIYGKTGTSSQADLVRKLLIGLPPLA